MSSLILRELRLNEIYFAEIIVTDTRKTLMDLKALMDYLAFQTLFSGINLKEILYKYNIIVTHLLTGSNPNQATEGFINFVG